MPGKKTIVGVPYFAGLKVKGFPNRRLLNQVIRLLEQGKVVKVLAATDADTAPKIDVFCKKFFGQKLPITNTIEASMRIIAATPGDFKVREKKPRE